MKQTHLSDSEIQAWIDGGADSDLERFKLHLDECHRCRKKADAYRQLAVLLDTDPAFTPEPGLEQRVMSALPPHPRQAERRNVDMILALGGFILVTAAALFLGGWKAFAEISPMFSEISASFSGMLSRIELPGHTAFLVPCAGLALLVVALLDHTVLKKHNGLTS
ncbi:hypothetical protein JXO52_15700 [bacterium]|nr:hypothetical protein [bacterium]